MKKSQKRIALNIVIPLCILLVLFVFFTVCSGGKTFTGSNLLGILDQAILTIFSGLGVIFVVSQGGADLSVGTTLAMSAVLAGYVGSLTGNSILQIPVAFVVCLLLGLLNGFLITTFKIPSFMLTLSMLIGVRGFINFLIERFGVTYASVAIRGLNSYAVKIPVLIAGIVLAVYLLEYTRFGRYSKAIGENERVAISVGIDVKKMKMIAYLISAFMAGVAGIFMTAKLGGTNYTMGSNFEMQVVMSTFLGGVLVTGGNSAKVPKLLIGAMTFAVVENGLVLCGWTSTDIKQIIEGMILMLVLFISIRFKDKIILVGAKPQGTGEGG